MPKEIYFLSYDGRGINDRRDKYTPRVATFTADNGDEFGNLFAASPELQRAVFNALAYVTDLVVKSGKEADHTTGLLQLELHRALETSYGRE